MKRRPVRGRSVSAGQYGEGSPSPYIEAGIGCSPMRAGCRYGEGSPSPYIEAAPPTGAGSRPTNTGKVRLPPTLKRHRRPQVPPGRHHTGKVRLPPTLKRGHGGHSRTAQSHTGKVRLPPTLKRGSPVRPVPGRRHTGKVRLPPTLKRLSRPGPSAAWPTYGEGSPSPYIEAGLGKPRDAYTTDIRGRFAFPLH